MDINTVRGCIRAMNPGMGPQQQLGAGHPHSPVWQSSQHLSVFLIVVVSLVLPLSTQNEPFCPHPPITHRAFAPIKCPLTQHCKVPGGPCFLLHDWGRPECGSLQQPPPPSSTWRCAGTYFFLRAQGSPPRGLRVGLFALLSTTWRRAGSSW